MDWTKLIVIAGPLALAAFAGTLLGGIALSFFWKNFGPWKILEEVKHELLDCRLRCEQRDAQDVVMKAEWADMAARYEILKAAVNRAGLGLQLGPIKLDPLEAKDV